MKIKFVAAATDLDEAQLVQQQFPITITDFDEYTEMLRHVEMTCASGECTCIGEVHMENDPRCNLNQMARALLAN